MAVSMQTFGLIAALYVLAYYISRSKRNTLKFLRGPPSSSWIFGNEFGLNHQFEVGKLEEPWIREYGTVFKTPGSFGEEFLYIMDPKALQHVLHTSGYHYPKTKDVRNATRRIFGRAIVWAEGSTHQRHRKALNPAFSASQLKTFLSLFQRSTANFTGKMQDELLKSDGDIKEGGKVFNMTRWLPKVTLDVIGESAFDYKFGALDEEDNILASTLRHLFDDSTAISKQSMFFRVLRRNLPVDPTFIGDRPMLITKEDKRFNTWLTRSQVTARDILKKKADRITEMADGENEDKDILSVLVRSNLLEDPNKRLDDEEVLSQMATLILAGHETTASTTTWILYELSRHPEHQERIFKEIQDLRNKKAENGEDLAFTPNDYDSMPFFNASIKEALRLYPIVITLFRCAERDDVIPLSEPVISTTGKKLTEIPVKQGQRIHMYIPGYNRLQSLWGEDANEWNPERFLDTKKSPTLGVYANLLTFSAGLRSCIGWRFALLEMQTIVAGLISSFSFSIDPEIESNVFRAQIGLMAPMVRGKEMEGPTMPLRVRKRN